MMQWAGVLYSNQNQITQNRRTKLRLEAPLGLFLPRCRTFPLLLLMFMACQTWTWYHPLGAQAVTSVQLNSSLVPRVPWISSPPRCPFIQSVSYLFVCDERGQTALPRWEQTAPTALPSLTDSAGNWVWFPTHISMLVTQNHPVLCILGMVSKRILSITFLGSGVRLILISSNRFWPVLTGCNWIKLAKTSSDQFRPVQTSSNQFRPVQTGSSQFKVVPNGSNPFKPVLADSGWFKQIPNWVGTSLNCPELVRISWNWLEPVWIGLNGSEPVRTGSNQLELVATGLNQLELVWSSRNLLAPVGTSGNWLNCPKPVRTGWNWSELSGTSLEPILTVWKQFEAAGSGLNSFELVGTGLNWFEPVWTIGDVSLVLHGQSSTTLELSLLSHKMAKNWMCRELQIFPQPSRRSLHPGPGLIGSKGHCSPFSWSR